MAATTTATPWWRTDKLYVVGLETAIPCVESSVKRKKTMLKVKRRNENKIDEAINHLQSPTPKNLLTLPRLLETKKKCGK